MLWPERALICTSFTIVACNGNVEAVVLLMYGWWTKEKWIVCWINTLNWDCIIILRICCVNNLMFMYVAFLQNRLTGKHVSALIMFNSVSCEEFCTYIKGVVKKINSCCKCPCFLTNSCVNPEYKLHGSYVGLLCCHAVVLWIYVLVFAPSQV
jgi:hypothetical protein